MGINKHLTMKILAWFCLYTIVTTSPLIVSAAMLLIGTAFPTLSINNLWPIYFMIPLVLILIGIVSLLTFGRRAYTMEAGVNPAIARDAMREQRTPTSDKKAMGLLIGLAGLSFILPLSPLSWAEFALYLLIRWTSSFVTLAVDVLLLVALIVVYVKWLRKYID